MRQLPTASQTVGPYWHIGLNWLATLGLAAAGVEGQRVTITGRVLDGDRLGVSDALLEIWQADAHGRYAHPEDVQEGPAERRFRGFCRVATDERGAFRVATIKPGPVKDPRGGLQAPHLLVSVFMRGLLKRLVTRIYFPDEPRNADDPVLRSVPAERRSTLIARTTADGGLEWNVLLQGVDETVFFDC